jgi:threonine aldolase
VAPVRTNIVVATLERRPDTDVVAGAVPRVVMASAMDADTLRLVTHRDAPRANCEQAAAVLTELLT